jgi:NTP pyrophosphatase (non-canonical NTP hydrolase)
MKGRDETFKEGGGNMNYVRTPDNLVQQRLDQELADVLMAISIITNSIARHLQILNGQRKAKGVNQYDK